MVLILKQKIEWDIEVEQLLYLSTVAIIVMS